MATGSTESASLDIPLDPLLRGSAEGCHGPEPTREGVGVLFDGGITVGFEQNNSLSFAVEPLLVCLGEAVDLLQLSGSVVGNKVGACDALPETFRSGYVSEYPRAALPG
jgi:hypothetical protein